MNANQILVGIIDCPHPPSPSSLSSLPCSSCSLFLAVAIFSYCCSLAFLGRWLLAEMEACNFAWKQRGSVAKISILKSVWVFLILKISHVLDNTQSSVDWRYFSVKFMGPFWHLTSMFQSYERFVEGLWIQVLAAVLVSPRVTSFLWLLVKSAYLLVWDGGILAAMTVDGCLELF